MRSNEHVFGQSEEHKLNTLHVEQIFIWNGK